MTQRKFSVLFVSSGNNDGGISPIVYSQGLALQNAGIDLDFFTIKGKGAAGYLKNISRLRKLIKQNHYDIIHAHYVFSMYVALLTFSGKKIIGSFMGSDTYGDVDEDGNIVFSSYFEIFLTKLIQPFLSKIVVKSPNIEKHIFMKKKCVVLPNGVNLDIFKETSSKTAREELCLEQKKRYLLFLGDKNNPRKNFELVANSFNELSDNDLIVLAPYPIPHEQVTKYLNAADVLVFPSYLEGSPNVVKEAMACNCPIVSTNVGDVKWVIGQTPGCYLSSFEIDEFSKSIQAALDFSQEYGRTKGYARILDLGLDAISVNKKLITLYNELID